MLFLPESVYKERRRLCKDLEGQKIIPAAAFRRMLEMDPDDDLALRELGILAETAGDSATAEEYFWRALHAHPLGWSAYLALSRHFGQQPDQQALSMGLAELAFRKLPLNEEFSDDGAPDPETAILPDLDGFEDMSKVEQYEALADELRRRRDLEPAAVTARLRPYRLIHLLHEGADIDEQFVNTMIAERTAIVPLLIGVLRGWARMYLPGDETFTVEIAIAILGEIGDAGVIPHLLEFAALADPDLSGVAGWALDRICELHPDQVSKVLGEIAPRLVVRDRIPVIGRVVRFPKIDASGALLEKLSENLGQAPKKDLDAFVPPLLGAMVLAKGRPGVEMARSALRRNTGLLSRNSRAECEEMIEVLGAGPFPTPPIPEPSPYSVYDICAGEAHWDEEEDEDFEHMDDDESYFSPPPTVHKAPKPGRNEPCWCGSGKKYKKCHQEEDERNERRESAPLRAPALEREFDELRRAIGSFLPDTATIKERRELLQEFLDDDERNETGISAFTDWMVHDWISPRSGLGVMEEFIQRQGDDLTPREREVLKSWSASHTALYEVQEVATGTGITVKDLITDEVFFVHDISLSKALVLWDGLLARVIDGERGREFSGVGLSVPRRQLEPMRRWLQEDRRSAGLPWPEYFKQNLPRIRRKPVELAKEWRSSLRLQNNDGHELILSKAVYKILDQPALIGALGAYFEPEEAGVRYVWLSDSKGDDGRTLLGSLTMEGAELVLECNSKKRLARGKKLLASAAGPALKHLRNEFTDHAELLRLASESPNPRPQKVDEIPIEVRQKLIGELMEKHFAKWPDTPLPALDGKTARQAVKTEAGRKKVTALLRDFENSEERKRRQGEPFYDISRLRDELGLTN